jgi:hypothetical protein
MAMDKLLDFKWGNIDLWRSEEMQLVQVGHVSNVTTFRIGPRAEQIPVHAADDPG